MYLFNLLLLLTGFTSFPPTPEVAPEPATVYLSTDYGASWDGITDGLPPELQTRNLTEHDGALYLSTYKYGVFILEENACEWRQSSAGLPIEEEFFHPTSLSVKGDLLVMGTYASGVYVSKNGGANWRKSFFNIPHTMVRTLLFTEDRLLAGTDAGIWESYDAGDSWKRIGDDLTSINGLTMHDGKLIVAKQNGMGVMEGEEVIWSDMESDWAILQLLKRGEYVYAYNYRNEIFRSKDGLSWEMPSLGFLRVKGLHAKNLPQALWDGFKPTLPADQPAGAVLETSRGWVVTVGGGC